MTDEPSPAETRRRADVKAKPKASPRPPATKAEIAALKRVDKTVVKRMRKR